METERHINPKIASVPPAPHPRQPESQAKSLSVAVTLQGLRFAQELPRAASSHRPVEGLASSRGTCGSAVGREAPAD